MAIDDAREGSVYYRPIDDQHAIVVYPMTFGKARLCLAERDGPNVLDGFCYASPERALEAAAVWTGDGDPLDGWLRNPQTGRRRVDGDPAKEYGRYDKPFDRKLAYNRAGEPITFLEYARLQTEDPEYYRVALDVIDDIELSTVWLGISFEDPPEIFETRIKRLSTGEYRMFRYATEAHAREIHAVLCTGLRDRKAYADALRLLTPPTKGPDDDGSITGNTDTVHCKPSDE